MSSVATHPGWRVARVARPLWWSLCVPRRTAGRILAQVERMIFGRKPNVTPLSYNWAYVRLLKRDFRDLAPQLTGRLVDLGAGTSPYHAIVGRHASSCIALDFPSVLPARDTRNIDRLGSDLERIPLADASADSAFCAQVLAHTRRPHVVARELSRILRPGGRAVVTSAFAAVIQCEPYDFTRYSPDGLAALLEDAGLRVVEKRVHGDLFTSIAVCVAMSLLLVRPTPRASSTISRTRRWLLAPLVLGLNMLSLLDAVLPLRRMPVGVLVVVEKPAQAAAAENR